MRWENLRFGPNPKLPLTNPLSEAESR
jgi:hypothetical protein